MGNCFPSAYKWLREKAGTRHRVPLVSSPRIRTNHLDLEFENLMLSDDTIEAAQRWYKKSRKRPRNTRTEIDSPTNDVTPTRLSSTNFTQQSGQIIDPAVFLTSGDSNYYSWISANDVDAPDDETPTAGASEGKCEILVADCSSPTAAASSTFCDPVVTVPNNSWLARFKNFRRSTADSYSRRAGNPYSQLLGTPNSENSGGAADLEWEPEAAMLPFLSADLRWEYLNNQASNTTRKYGTNCSVIGGDYTNLSSRQTEVQPRITTQSTNQKSAVPTTTNCSTPRSGRSSSPALEWDTDDIMDPETSELLTEIDRIAQNLNQSAWSA